jgi:hypothetical protein
MLLESNLLHLVPIIVHIQSADWNFLGILLIHVTIKLLNLKPPGLMTALVSTIINSCTVNGLNRSFLKRKRYRRVHKLTRKRGLYTASIKSALNCIEFRSSSFTIFIKYVSVKHMSKTPLTFNRFLCF